MVGSELLWLLRGDDGSFQFLWSFLNSFVAEIVKLSAYIEKRER